METIQYTISGMTQDGQKFRPSDWTERLVCTQPEQLKARHPNQHRGRADILAHDVANHNKT